MSAQCFLVQWFIVSEMGEEVPQANRIQPKQVVGIQRLDPRAATILARPERFELPTYCSGGLAARQINDLARLVRSEIP